MNSLFTGILSLFSLSVFSQQFEWINTFDSYFAYAEGVAKASNGDVYVTGEHTTGYATHPGKFFIRRYSMSGNVIWRDSCTCPDADLVSIGVVSDQMDFAYTAFTAYPNKNVVIGGNTYTGYSLYLVKYSPTGQIQWVSPSVNSSPGSSRMTIGNQGTIFLIVGQHILEYNSSGNCIQTINMTGYGYDISLDGSGNIFTLHQHCIAKRDGNGNVIWQYSATGDICADVLGNCYLTFCSGNGQSNLVKINSSGQMVWVINSFNGANGSSVFVDNNGDIYTTGVKQYQNADVGMGIAKYDSSGNQSWYYFIPNYTNNYNHTFKYYPFSIIAFNGSIYVCGHLTESENAFLLKISEPATTAVQEINGEGTLSVFPNPSPDIFNLSFSCEQKGDPIYLSVYDATGKC